MDVLINHVSVMPRPDGGPKLFKPENAVTRLTFDHDHNLYRLEITDKDNPEFRARVSFSDEELVEVKQE